MTCRFLSSAFLDRNKYRLLNDSNDLLPIYNSDWYLDVVADNWGAFVWNDYEAALPVSVNKKFLINYIYQPFFTRNMTVAGRLPVHDLMESITKASPEIRYFDFCIDTGKALHDDKSGIKKIYQFLELTDYDNIYKNYAGNLKRSIRDAEKAGISIHPVSDLRNFTDSFRLYTAQRIPEFKDKDYQKLLKVLEACMVHAETYFLSAFLNDTELASAFFARKGNKIIYIEGFSSPQGRKLQAMHLIFDRLIKQNTGKGLVIDFGGSNIPSIAHFFHAFGATDASYYQIVRNRLPAFIRFLKKSKS